MGLIAAGLRKWRKVLTKTFSPVQHDIFKAVKKHNKVAIKSCHASGKTYSIARIVVDFLLTHPDSRVIVTAPTFSQIYNIVFPEIRTAIYSLRDDTVFNYLFDHIQTLQTMIRINNKWYAVGISTDKPERMQGHHSETAIMVVVDEASGVDNEMFKAIDGILSSGKKSKLVLIGNPTRLTGEFYKAFDDDTFKKISISCFDTPNFISNGIKNMRDLRKLSLVEAQNMKLVTPYMIKPAWAVEKLQSWGEDSLDFSPRVLGRFAEAEEDSLVPRHQILKAFESYDDEVDKDARYVAGLDVAYLGSDKTALCVRRGSAMIKLKTYRKTTHKRLIEIAEKAFIDYDLQYLNIDVSGGYGLPAMQELSAMGYNVVGINSAKKSPVTGYSNLRAYGYWSLRELFLKNQICLQHDDDILEELLATKYFKNAKAQTQIQKKEKIKEKIARSPDKADALMLAFLPSKNRKVIII